MLMYVDLCYATIRNHPQPSATIRDHPQPSATICDHPRPSATIRSLSRRRHDVGHFRHTLRTPIRTGTNQTELRPSACQLNRVRELSHTEPEAQDLVG